MNRSGSAFGVAALAAGAVAALGGACGSGSGQATGASEGPIAAVAQAAASCVTLQRGVFGNVADASIQQQAPSLNHGGLPTLVAGTASTGTHQQALIAFDLSPIPAGAPLVSASVTLTEDALPGPAWYPNPPGLVAVHRITAPWEEGTVTWTSFAEAYDATLASSFVSTATTASVTFDVTALVASWLAGATPNYGILLDEAGSQVTYLPSSESETQAARPSLTVCYGCPAGFGDCDGNPANGCETPLDTLQDCGGCGVACGGPCSSATCATGTCVTTPEPDGTACDDGNACTQMDVCTGGACVGSNPFTLTALESRGADRTCGLAPGGAAYCWGYGDGLGDGQAGGYSDTPALVSGGIAFASITTGDNFQSLGHTCALTAAGAAYCWGSNDFGQLGDGTLEDSTAPVPVAGGFHFASISAGGRHTCALTTSGAAYCWGNDSDGQLGVGAVTPDTEQYTTPVPVTGGLLFTSISAGGFYYGFTCAVAIGGTAYCWGDESWGELGNGVLDSEPSPVVVATPVTFASVSAGGYGACGVSLSGDGYCWGEDTFGELGTGAPASETCFLGDACSTTPVPVAGGLAFQSIVEGTNYACGIASSGATYCWGAGGNGQIGNGDGVNEPAPALVSGGLSFASVTAGRCASCGITTAGAVECWGCGNGGEIGDGKLSAAYVPTPVTAGPNIACTGDACHTPGTCDPATGACSIVADANGTACNDGDPCTSADACQGGVCTGGSAACGSLCGLCTPGEACVDSLGCVSGSCPYPSFVCQ
jgi:alpha-tubulin suppressor-like RCC1 family protein